MSFQDQVMISNTMEKGKGQKVSKVEKMIGLCSGFLSIDSEVKIDVIIFRKLRFHTCRRQKTEF